LGRTVKLLGFAELPRQDMSHGRIREYRFYVSPDGKDWGSPVREGRFPNSDSLQTVRWDEPVTGRYIRLVALSEWSGEYYATVAELDVLAAK
jgi:beta-galactosidase